MAQTKMVSEPLLPATHIREVAAEDPERVVCSLPRTQDPRDGFTDINYSQLKTAIDFASHWFVEKLGIGESFETVGYIGPQDVRYLILSIAAWQTGWKVCHISDNRAPLNTAAFRSVAEEQPGSSGKACRGTSM